jgi:flavin-dependent dehydrogenase
VLLDEDGLACGAAHRARLDLARSSPPRRSSYLPLRRRARRRVAGRVLLVGDAGGYVGALTGESIALGLAQARAAVDAVAAGRPDRDERPWRRLGWRHDLLTKGLLAAARHPALRGRVVPAAAALPWVFGAAVNQHARPA